VALAFVPGLDANSAPRTPQETSAPERPQLDPQRREHHRCDGDSTDRGRGARANTGSIGSRSRLTTVCSSPSMITPTWSPTAYASVSSTSSTSTPAMRESLLHTVTARLRSFTCSTSAGARVPNAWVPDSHRAIRTKIGMAQKTMKNAATARSRLACRRCCVRTSGSSMGRRSLFMVRLCARR